jgi:hypothetical protein
MAEKWKCKLQIKLYIKNMWYDRTAILQSGAVMEA